MLSADETGKIPARELAERYEVSVRTIYRDVEMLSMAGVPVFASKGRGGGISLMEHCVIDKMFVNEDEGQILAALESLRETASSDNTELLQKLGDFSRHRAAIGYLLIFVTGAGGRTCFFPC